MGVITGMSNEVYHQQSGISSSAVKAVYKKSLAHWKGEKRKQTAAFSMGSAVHAHLLEPERNLVIKGPKTKRSKAFEEMESNLQEDQILLTEVEYNVSKRIAQGALNNTTCRQALEHPERKNEVSIFAKCPRTGLMLKCRPDSMSEQTAYDIKTTQDASPKGFGNRETHLYAYDIQAAFYVYVCSLVPELDIKEFAFIACEKASPYIAHMHVVSPELMASATERMHQTLDVMAAAEKAEEYGTGWGDYTLMTLPKWL